MFSFASWANNNTRELFQLGNPHGIVGLWNLSYVEDGLEFKCKLEFNDNHVVRIKMWTDGFDPNIGSFTIILEEEGTYQILDEDTLLTNWNSNTAKITIADLLYTDALTDLIKEHPEIEKELQEMIEYQLEKTLKDIAEDMNLLNDKMTIQGISDRELIIGDLQKTYNLKREK